MVYKSKFVRYGHKKKKLTLYVPQFNSERQQDKGLIICCREHQRTWNQGKLTTARKEVPASDLKHVINIVIVLINNINKT